MNPSVAPIEELFTSVVAEDAPIGVQLWPTRTPESAPNFTLREVQIVRTATQTYVRWVYENGNERVFQLGQTVSVRIERTCPGCGHKRTCPGCGHKLMDPSPKGQAGDNSYYCEGCGQAWSLDLGHQML